MSINKSSVLSEAIDISGGAKFLKGQVSFIRYNNDGTIDKRKFGLKRNVSRGSYENPFLKNGDVIFVGRSSLNITTEIINEITAPFQSLFTTYGFYKLVVDQ